MRRISIALICVLGTAALLAGTASAATVPYEAKVKADHPAGKITWNVVRRDGRPKRVKRVRFDEIKLKCEMGGNTFVSEALLGSAKVGHDGRFALGDSDVSFRGRIGNDKAARGRIVVHFDHPFNGACVNKTRDWAGGPA